MASATGKLRCDLFLYVCSKMPKCPQCKCWTKKHQRCKVRSCKHSPCCHHHIDKADTEYFGSFTKDKHFVDDKLRLQIKKSTIPRAGYGLFTKDEIKENKRAFGIYSGVELKESEIGSDYSLQCGPQKRTFDAENMDTWESSPFRFMNMKRRASDNNVRFIDGAPQEQKGVYDYTENGTRKRKTNRRTGCKLRAEKNIPAGGELFAFYGKDYKLPGTQRWECDSCGKAYTHRGWLARHMSDKHPARQRREQSGRIRSKTKARKLKKSKQPVPANTWACTTCGKLYKHKGSRTRHIKQKHSQ